MNTYILYCQETKESLYKLQAVCRDVYEVDKGSETAISIYLCISELVKNRSTFAITDPNGAVIACDLAIRKCGFDKDDRVTVETFQLRRI